MPEAEKVKTLLRDTARSSTPLVNRVVLNPITYLILYLTAIFGFAWLFYASNDAIFYAPYAKLEPASQRDYMAVEAEIYRSISQRTPSRDETGWRLESLDISELAIAETGDFSFTLTFVAHHTTNGSKDRSASGPVDIKVSRRPLIYSGGQRICRFVSMPEDSIQETVTDAIFKQSKFDIPMLCLDTKAEYRLQKIRSGWSGDPKAFSSSYGRMLYLSAITITSVGYGDIVPMSDKARLLCGLEAVLGWLIAGFFLSVIAIRRR